VHLLHIGKTGGTAVKAALGEAESAPSLIIHPHEISLRDIPAGDGVIFFVRDPITRFVSGFYSRKRQGRPSHDVPWTREERRAFEQFETPDALATAIEEDADERRGEARAAMQSIEHVRSSYWDWCIDEQYLASRWDDILFVGQLESLNDDFVALKKILNWPGDVTLPRDPDRAHKSPTGEDRTLSEAATLNLSRWYAAEYRFLQLCAEWRAGSLQLPFAVEYAMPGAAQTESA
jgi:hypothetical protein